MSKLTATDWIWRDGEFVRWDDAHVHVLSHSMQYGSAAFEGIRCYDTPRGPAIFRLDAHLQRLIVSCRIYRMDVTYSIDDLVTGCCAATAPRAWCRSRVPSTSTSHAGRGARTWARVPSRTASTPASRPGSAYRRTRYPPLPRSPATT